MSPAALTLVVALSGCRATAPASPAVTSAPAPVSPPAGEHGPGHGHGHGHAHGGDAFTDPARHVAAWNAPERDAWQKPDELVAALALRPGDTVVDLGAGTGYLVPPLSRAVGPTGTVIAADIAPEMLRFLDEAAAREGWGNVRTHPTAADDPKLAPGSARAVVALNVWHHLEGREAYAAKVAAALAPGGALVIVDFLAEPTEGFGPPLEMRLRAEQVVQELTAGGLTASIVPETMPRHYVVRGVKPG